MGPLAELYQKAQAVALVITGSILANAIDADGHPVSFQVSAEEPDSQVTALTCVVGIEGGRDEETLDYGTIGIDPATPANYMHLIRSADCKLTWTLYCTKDFERRYYLDVLKWNMYTAYATDPNGVRVDNAVFQAFRNWGIIPARRPFDPPGYPPPNTGPSEGRPHGLPFRGILKLNCDIQTSWSVPGVLPQAVLTITATNQPGWPGISTGVIGLTGT